MNRVLYAAVLTLCILMSGCTTTRYVPVVSSRTDTVRITKWQRDSVWKHDSVTVRVAGDTVTIERWKTEYRERQVHDTIYESRRDTVPVPYPVEVEVGRRLTQWQQARLWLGNIVLVALAGAAAVWAFRRRAWWLRLFRKLL